MFGPGIGGAMQQTTNYRVVLPFYLYASIFFLIGAGLLLLHTDVTETHYFNPYTLAITHTMALGWGNDYFWRFASVITGNDRGQVEQRHTGLSYLRICSHWHSHTHLWVLYISYRMGFANRRHIGKSGNYLLSD